MIKKILKVLLNNVNFYNIYFYKILLKLMMTQTIITKKNRIKSFCNSKITKTSLLIIN